MSGEAGPGRGQLPGDDSGQYGSVAARLPSLVVGAVACLLDADDGGGGAALDDHGSPGWQHTEQCGGQQRDLLMPAAQPARLAFGGPDADGAAGPLGHGAQFVFRGAAEDDLGFAALPDDRGALGAPPLLELGVGLGDQGQADAGPGP